MSKALAKQLDGAYLVRLEPQSQHVFVWFGGKQIYEYDLNGDQLATASLPEAYEDSFSVEAYVVDTFWPEQE